MFDMYLRVNSAYRAGVWDRPGDCDEHDSVGEPEAADQQDQDRRHLHPNRRGHQVICKVKVK